MTESKVAMRFNLPNEKDSLPIISITRSIAFMCLGLYKILYEIKADKDNKDTTEIYDGLVSVFMECRKFKLNGTTITDCFKDVIVNMCDSIDKQYNDTVYDIKKTLLSNLKKILVLYSLKLCFLQFDKSSLLGCVTGVFNIYIEGINVKYITPDYYVFDTINGEIHTMTYNLSPEIIVPLCEGIIKIYKDAILKMVKIYFKTDDVSKYIGSEVSDVSDYWLENLDEDKPTREIETMFHEYISIIFVYIKYLNKYIGVANETINKATSKRLRLESELLEEADREEKKRLEKEREEQNENFERSVMAEEEQVQRLKEEELKVKENKDRERRFNEELFNQRTQQLFKSVENLKGIKSNYNEYMFVFSKFFKMGNELLYLFEMDKDLIYLADRVTLIDRDTILSSLIVNWDELSSVFDTGLIIYKRYIFLSFMPYLLFIFSKVTFTANNLNLFSLILHGGLNIKYENKSYPTYDIDFNAESEYEPVIIAEILVGICQKICEFLNDNKLEIMKSFNTYFNAFINIIKRTVDIDYVTEILKRSGFLDSEVYFFVEKLVFDNNLLVIKIRNNLYNDYYKFSFLDITLNYRSPKVQELIENIKRFETPVESVTPIKLKWIEASPEFLYIYEPYIIKRELALMFLYPELINTNTSLTIYRYANNVTPTPTQIIPLSSYGNTVKTTKEAQIKYRQEKILVQSYYIPDLNEFITSQRPELTRKLLEDKNVKIF